jgi:hypothetical protein
MIRRRLSSYADVFGVTRENSPEGEPVTAGDIVRTRPNREPRYRVIAVSDGKAWVRGLARGRDFVVPVGRLRRVEQRTAHEAGQDGASAPILPD